MMTRTCCSLATPLILALSIALSPLLAQAGGPAPQGGQCLAGTVCDRSLGVAIVPAPGWILIPRWKFPPHTLAFGIHPGTGIDYDIRLIVEPYATTSIANDARAARLVAGKLIRAERVSGARQIPITVGGSAGVLVRGLPSGPAAATDIVVAHRTLVYLIIAPGSALASDQRAALASLRFIQQSGSFLPPVGG